MYIALALLALVLIVVLVAAASRVAELEVRCRSAEAELERAETAAAAPGEWLASRTHDRLIVHTLDGQTFEGVATVVAPDGVVLSAARLVDADMSLAGDVFVPVDRVAFVQRPAR